MMRAQRERVNEESPVGVAAVTSRDVYTIV
jgi:hypothetical protein